MPSPLFATKPIEQLMHTAENAEHGLKRALSAIDLTALGVGAIIGAGIFVLTGNAAAMHAGPAIIALDDRRRDRLRLRGPVLRRDGVDDPDRRQRLHLLLRDARRVRGLDHRLGPDPRVRARGRDGVGGLGGTGDELPRAVRDRHPAAVDDRPVPDRDARGRHGGAGHLQPAGVPDRAGGDRDPDRGRARVGERQQRDRLRPRSRS